MYNGIKLSSSSQNSVQAPSKRQIMCIVSIILWFLSNFGIKHSVLSAVSALNYDEVAQSRPWVA